MSFAAAFRLATSSLKPVALLLLLLALAACGRSPTNYVGIPGDNDPHDGVRRAWGLPIQGLDIARYQGRVDFDKARAGGVHFIYIKSTEGKDYIDPNFYTNWQGARAAGVARGAYHFMTWCSLASEQADWFVRNVPADYDSLPPVLDLEWNNHLRRNKHDRADVLEKVRVMLAAMEAHTKKVPVIYTDMNFYRDVLQGEHFDNSFWLRSTAAEPHLKYGGKTDWLIWQWTQTGTMSGVNAEVDRNAFYGTQDQWVQFLLTGCDPRKLHILGPQGRCTTK